ncbi:MAG: hypothetical protein AAGA72_03200 [Pseudomonadota bacterium]
MRILDNHDVEHDMEDWMRRHGLRLVRVSDQERSAARQRLSSQGDPARRCALRLLALWSIAPRASNHTELPFIKDIGDFLQAEGFAVEDHWGERTFTPEEKTE